MAYILSNFLGWFLILVEVFVLNGSNKSDSSLVFIFTLEASLSTVLFPLLPLDDILNFDCALKLYESSNFLSISPLSDDKLLEGTKKRF